MNTRAVIPLAEHHQQCERLQQQIDALTRLIHTPHTEDWIEAVRLEAAHQQIRWGVDHDAGKAPEDWFWLLGYLAGKAVAAFRSGDTGKGLHHIISSSAALLNWHRYVTGEAIRMRPGIHPPDGKVGERCRSK